MSDTIDIQNLKFSVPAKVLRPQSQRATDLLAIAREKHAFDADALEDPFFWTAEISSDLVDSHHSHMLPSTLENFRRDAEAGVSFLPGHRHYELPFGRSLAASIESATDPERTRVLADFYTLPGLNLNGISTNDLITGIRSGILKDVSVGFHGGNLLCDVCNRDYFGGECYHIAGWKYEVKGDDGVVRIVTATYAIDGARLSEVSSVFDGSTPKAEIIKAEREAAEGRMRPDAIRLFEQQYRVRLPVPAKQFRGVAPQEDKRAMNYEQIVNQIREVLSVPTDGDVVEVATRLSADAENVKTIAVERDTLKAKVAEAEQRIAKLEPQAADGAQYRSDLVAEALAEGVRAQGKDFDADTYKAILESAPLATIKRMRDDWQRIGNAKFPGGRTTTNEGEPAPGANSRKTNRLPDSAFAV